MATDEPEAGQDAESGRQHPGRTLATRRRKFLRRGPPGPGGLARQAGVWRMRAVNIYTGLAVFAEGCQAAALRKGGQRRPIREPEAIESLQGISVACLLGVVGGHGLY